MSDVSISIIRLKSNEELIAIVEGIYEGELKVEHPYFIKFNSSSNMLGMVPYCPLSDEIYYSIKLDRIEFIVSAKKVVESKYLQMIKEDFDLDDDSSDKKQVNHERVMLVEGNDTKH